MPFHLISAFYYEAAAKTINLLTNYTLDALMKKGAGFCAQPWDQLKLDYPAEKYLYLYCFNAAYQSALLYQVYGFDRFKTFIVTQQIDNNEVDWTLGVALMHSLKSSL